MGIFSSARGLRVPQALLLVAAAVGGVSCPAANPGKRTNIVYLLLDDAGYGDLGCYGQQKLKTPNIDRLADEGLRFTDHYSGSTVCAPTRCVLMTGLHTGHAEVRGNKDDKTASEGEYPIRADAVTVGTLLSRAGYATGCFGKWGLGGPGSTGDVVRHGFGRFYGYKSQLYAHDLFPRWLWKDRDKVRVDRQAYSHTLIWDEATSFIRNNRDRPFFCYLPITIPHASMQAPPEYEQRFRKRYPQFEDVVGEYYGDDRVTKVRNPIAGFAAMMTKLDDDVGQLMTLLKELGIDGNTVVMLSSDNGPHREGGHDPAFWDSNGPLRGMKRDLYEGGIRCPMIVRWPGMVAAGTITDHLSAHWDVLPTLCEIAGTKPPAGVDGISFLPTLTGRDKQRRHDYLYWEYGPKRAVRRGNWKAVQNNLPKQPPAPIELYDLANDLGEEHDVAADHPAVVKKMRAVLGSARTPDPVWDNANSGG